MMVDVRVVLAVLVTVLVSVMTSFYFINTQIDPNLAVTKCTEITDQAQRDSCFQYAAQDSNDYRLCDYIQSAYPVPKSSWATISTENCYRNIAAATQDQGICEATNNQSVFDRCSEGIREPGLAFCHSVGMTAMGEYRTSCYRRAALASGDPSICRFLPHNYSRDDCFRQLATSLNDSTLCAEIADEFWRQLCMQGTQV